MGTRHTTRPRLLDDVDRALRDLQDIPDLAGRIHDAGWWPYRGGGAAAGGGGTPVAERPSPLAGDNPALVAYGRVVVGLQRALLTAHACAGGEDPPTFAEPDSREQPLPAAVLPHRASIRPPSDLATLCRTVAELLRELRPAASDPEATPEIRRSLDRTCHLIHVAHRRAYAEGHPATGGKASKGPAKRKRPTEPDAATCRHNVIPRTCIHCSERPR